MLFDTLHQQQALAMLERNEAAYGYFDVYKHHNGDPFERLIRTMLSHRTNRADEHAAYDAMWSCYGSWEAIQNADTDELADLLARSRFPDAKAKNIQRTLEKIKSLRGEYNIDFLANLPTDEAMEWLLDLPGVGIKTASLVLLFCFKRPVMPVDTHVHRVTRRLGIIGENVKAERAHERLLEILPSDPQLLYHFHVTTMKHGQQVCHYHDPACHRCPLIDLCDYAERNDKRPSLAATRQPALDG